MKMLQVFLSKEDAEFLMKHGIKNIVKLKSERGYVIGFRSKNFFNKVEIVLEELIKQDKGLSKRLHNLYNTIIRTF